MNLAFYKEKQKQKKNKMKTCVVCKKKKGITAFYKNKGNRDGYSNKCKQCARKYTIERKNKLKNPGI